jgi:hypothetical protein
MTSQTYDTLPRTDSRGESRKADFCIWFIKIEMAAYYGVLGAAGLTIAFLASLH